MQSLKNTENKKPTPLDKHHIWLFLERLELLSARYKAWYYLLGFECATCTPVVLATERTRSSRDTAL